MGDERAPNCLLPSFAHMTKCPICIRSPDDRQGKAQLHPQNQPVALFKFTAGPQNLPHDSKAATSGEGTAEKLVGLPDQRSSRKRTYVAICLGGPSAVKRPSRILMFDAIHEHYREGLRITNDQC